MDKALNQQIDDMATAIKTTIGAVDMVAGGQENIDSVAHEWVVNGFDADNVAEWWEAGAFDPDRTAYLRDMGLTPVQAGEDHPVKGCTWAYGYSNGDISDLEVHDFFKSELNA